MATVSSEWWGSLAQNRRNVVLVLPYYVFVSAYLNHGFVHRIATFFILLKIGFWVGSVELLMGLRASENIKGCTSTVLLVLLILLYSTIVSSMCPTILLPGDYWHTSTNNCNSLSVYRTNLFTGRVRRSQAARARNRGTTVPRSGAKKKS